MAKKKINEEETKVIRKEKIRSVDQLTIARMISNKTGLTISDVQEVIELEQKFTMDFIKRNRKVIKKNYLTLTPTIIPGKTFISPLNGQEYYLPSRRGVSIRVGDGFKAYISDVKKMPDKICRFVDEKNSDEIPAEDVS